MYASDKVKNAPNKVTTKPNSTETTKVIQIGRINIYESPILSVTYENKVDDSFFLYFARTFNSDISTKMSYEEIASNWDNNFGDQENCELPLTLF